jgi:hypothetical protein
MEKNRVLAATFLWGIQSDEATVVLAKACLGIQEDDVSIEAVDL